MYVDRFSTNGYIELVDRLSTKFDIGGAIMNYELLKKVIDDNGIKLTVLAKKMGISRQSLHMKINGMRFFDQGEMMSLKGILNLTDREFMTIFFGKSVDKLPTREKV